MSKQNAQIPVKKAEWIADMLSQVPIVEWDRFTVGERDGHQCVTIYGWIDRDDEYKDFVWARFWPESEDMGFTTSSSQYSAYLQAEWFGEETLDDHNECRRVEDAFDVDNAIELHQDASLDGFGGEA